MRLTSGFTAVDRVTNVLLVAIVVAATTSCHDTTGPGDVNGPPALTTRLDSIFSIGDTIRLTVNGPDSNLVWQSRNPLVALVTQTGQVTAVSTGDSWVLVFRDPARPDSAHIVVKQRVASLTISPAAISRPLHRTQIFAAIPVDARGYPVSNANAVWSTSSDVATIDISGTATANNVGATTIRASVNDISATAQLSVTPLPALRFNLDTVVVGVGQYSDGLTTPPRVVADSISPGESFTAVLQIVDQAVATVSQSTVAVPEGSGSHTSPPLQLLGRAAGTTQLNATDGQFTPGTTTIRVSTPRLIVNGPTVWPKNLYYNYISILTADSLGIAHTIAQPLAIRVRTRAPLVVSPVDTTVTINPGQDYVQFPLQRGDSGQTWLVVSAPGYRDDSIHVTLSAPKLRFVRYDMSNVESASVGASESHDGNLFVFADCCLPTDLPVTIAQRHPELLRAPHTLLVPAMDYGGRVQVQVAGLQPGLDTLIASAPGYLSDTLPFTVTTPTFQIAGYPATTTTVGFPFTLDASLIDSLGNTGYPISGVAKVLVVSSDASILRPSADTLVIGNSTGGGGLRIDVTGSGTATLTLRDPLGVFRPVTTPQIVVAPTKLLVSSGYPPSAAPRSVGMHQLVDGSVRIATGGAIADSIRLHSTDATIVRPDVAGVQSNYNATSFTVVGGERSGTAWIVASAPGLISDSLPFDVGRPTLAVTSPSLGTAGQTGYLYVQLRDQMGNGRVTSDSVTFRIVSSDGSIVAADSTVTVLAGQNQSKLVTVRFVGAGTAVLRVIDDRNVPYAYEPGASSIIQVSAPPSP